MKQRIVLTHKGWYGLCPVYIGALDSDEPIMGWRHWAAAPLFWISMVIEFTIVQAMLFSNPDVETSLPLRVTGRLDKAIIDWADL